MRYWVLSADGDATLPRPTYPEIRPALMPRRVVDRLLPWAHTRD